MVEVAEVVAFLRAERSARWTLTRRTPPTELVRRVREEVLVPWRHNARALVSNHDLLALAQNLAWFVENEKGGRDATE